jgi:two-component system response regulator AtoC
VETEITLIEESTGGASGVARGYHLVIMAPDAFVTIPLPERGTVTIGRSSDSHVKLDDPMASRRHAVLHAEGGRFRVEDSGSANGTRLRDEPLAPHALTAIEAGEAVVIGSTVLMVQQNRASVGMRRLGTHSAFESRLEDECARASATGGSFVLARFQLERGSPWPKVLPVLARELPSPHALATYGPNDFEALLVEVAGGEVDRLVGQTLAGLRGAGVSARVAMASYPTDGRSAQALLSHVNRALKPGLIEPGAAAAAAAAAPSAEAGQDPRMEAVVRLTARAALSSINVLVLGETGVGKEVLARSLHVKSARAQAPFVALNCAGLTETLIESELFGHERGAFTGAVTAKPGLLETANGGTLFLDEIGEMPLTIQGRLLRVLETREVLPVGGIKPRSIDVRFVSATNRDLEAEVLGSSFRRDLFFRLNGLSISIPPLRERVREIPGLAQLFLEQACRESSRPVPEISTPAMQLLQRYRWPGNIRELKNVIERAVVLCEENTIELAHLPVDKMRPSASVVVPAGGSSATSDAEGLVLESGGRPQPPLTADEQAERDQILEALQQFAGNQTAAARALGIPRRTFVARLTRYSVPRPRKRS